MEKKNWEKDFCEKKKPKRHNLLFMFLLLFTQHNQTFVRLFDKHAKINRKKNHATSIAAEMQRKLRPNPFFLSTFCLFPLLLFSWWIV